MGEQLTLRQVVAAMERNGAELYRRLLALVESPDVRDVLTYLEEQEEEHERILGELAGDTDAAALERAFEETGELPRLLLEEAESAARRVARIDSVEQALDLGLELERSSARLYRELTAKLRDPALAKQTARLAREERGHYQLLFLFRSLVREGKTIEATLLKRQLEEAVRFDEAERDHQP